MADDDTEFGIDAITEGMDPEKRRAAARLIRRNALVSELIIWAVRVIIAAVLSAAAAYFAGLIG